jgi:hypothetical protein
MTSVITIRPAVVPSLVLTALLVVMAPGGSRAEGPVVSPLDIMLHETNDSASPVARGGQGSPGLAAAPTPGPETAGESTLTENAWDFTQPDSIPGFASTPYPVLSNPEIAD